MSESRLWAEGPRANMWRGNVSSESDVPKVSPLILYFFFLFRLLFSFFFQTCLLVFYFVGIDQEIRPVEGGKKGHNTCGRRQPSWIGISKDSTSCRKWHWKMPRAWAEVVHNFLWSVLLIMWIADNVTLLRDRCGFWCRFTSFLPQLSHLEKA